MKINLETYELYVIDFLEGKLSSKLMAEFDAFLLIHPEIKKEIEDLNQFQLNDTIHTNFDNSFLKKDIFSETNINENFEDLCIEYIENGFDCEEKKEFENYISNNPSRKNIFKQFQSTILNKDFINTQENFRNLLKQLILNEEDYFDEIAIAYNENDLTKGEKLSLEEDLESNSNFNKKIKTYNKLVLKANKKIVYGNKAELKQTDKINLLIKYSLSIAASILFLILIPTSRISDNKISYLNKTDYSNYKSINSNDSTYKTTNNNITKKTINRNTISEVHSKYIETQTKNNKHSTIGIKNSLEEIESISKKRIIKELKIPIFAFNEKIQKHRIAPTKPLKNISNEETYAEETILNQKKVRFWQVASIAVNIFSKATKSEILLNSEYDENGNLKAIDFISSNFNYTKQYKHQ